MYKLVIANNIELRNAEVKAEYEDKAQAIQALYTEIALAAAEYGVDGRYSRFTDFGDAVSVDFGSWSHFVGLTGININDLWMWDNR